MIEQHAHYSGAAGQSLARETIDFLKANDLSASPQNYQVWISHLAGVSRDLSRAVKTQLMSRQRLDDTGSQALFDRFFGNTVLAVEMLEVSESIASELSSLMSNLRGVGDRAGSYADSLCDGIATIERGGNSLDARAVMTSLAAATREMIANSRKLAEEMQASSRRVEILQSALHKGQS